MAIDIELATNLIQAVNQGISGVQLAPSLDKYPTALDTANLPCLLTWPADGAWYAKGGGYKVDHRTFLIVGYIQPLGQSDIPSRAVDAVRLFQTVRARYITAATIPLADPDDNSGYQITAESGPETRHTDGGLQSDLRFGGTLYHGFIVRLSVRILFSV